MNKLIFILSLIITNYIYAQFAPAANIAGSTAIYKDSSIIVSWATSFQNYFIGDSLDTTWQHPEKALGIAEGTSGDIVSLGRGGQITLSFDTLIVNGIGPDFVCFENGFSDNFLELSWVEVSFDGINFERFPNYSFTETAISAFGTIEPTKISGYCSKYRQGYGTPFDLDSVNLDTIKYVRFIDIIGDSTCLDTKGDIIFDPYPTTGSAGVDIDAVGVINAGSELSSIDNYYISKNIKIYPNPAKSFVQIAVNNKNYKIKYFEIIDISGRLIKQSKYENSIDISDFKNGIYFINIFCNDIVITKKLIVE